MALSGNANDLNKIASITPAPFPTLDTHSADGDGFEDEKDVREKDRDSNGELKTTVPDLFGEELDDPDKIIRSGADAAQYMLSDRDDGDPSVTVRSMVLGTAFAAFYASISQIYQVSSVASGAIRPISVLTNFAIQFKPTTATIGGSFICLIIWFAGRAWAVMMPRGDRLEEKWRKRLGEEADTTPLPKRIKLFKLLNPSAFGLKEHAIAAITASSASNGAASIQVFTTQNLYYPDNPLSPMIVILSTLSIGLFGYGLTGLFRPITVDNAEAVYWSQLPLLSLLQNLHWSDLRTSKRLRWFWYAFGFMTIYQTIPGYMFPWLNSVSIPCLAAMHATGAKAEILTNIFGGALNNEGLGIFNFSFDWQYVSARIPKPEDTVAEHALRRSLPSLPVYR